MRWLDGITDSMDNDAEAEAPILWPPDTKSQFIRKDPNARED